MACISRHRGRWPSGSEAAGRLNRRSPSWRSRTARRKFEWSTFQGVKGASEGTLKPLTESQRIIGFTWTDEASARAVAAQLFPGDELILIRLDAHDPIPGTPACWESLDALLLDPAAAARLDDHRLGVLVAGGVAIVVQAEKPPLPHWPWQTLRRADPAPCWSLKLSPLGQRAATYSEAAYRPAAGWRTGWPAEFRRRMLLMAIIFCVLVLAIVLMRPPLVTLWVIGFTGLAVTGLALFWKFQTTLTQRYGEVVVLDGRLVQIDDWLYQTSFRSIAVYVNWGEYTKPILTGPWQLAESRVELFCFSNGDPELLHHDLGAGQKMALMMRRVGPRGPDAKPTQPVTSPLLDLVKDLYLTHDDTVTGELPSSPLLGTPYASVEIWPAVVIDRRAPPPAR